MFADRCVFAVAGALLFLGQAVALAQIAPSRTIEELKTETQARAIVTPIR